MSMCVSLPVVMKPPAVAMLMVPSIWLEAFRSRLMSALCALSTGRMAVRSPALVRDFDGAPAPVDELSAERLLQSRDEPAHGGDFAVQAVGGR